CCFTGKGEFGDVFLARARHIQEGEAQSLVLVKSLTSCDSVHINEFHRQLELFGQSDHDYVTRLLGVCMEQEPFYILLEYCEWVSTDSLSFYSLKSLGIFQLSLNNLK
ncbi:unnamed protein product, partial [Schistosoma curassoni]|uniref:Protein kinase domain-containing protein n=1 Tax=Schistosoma curassoni TaxID=6186 RepID=A0A183JQX2_9TREM